MKNKKLVIAVIAVVVVMGILAGVYFATRPDPNEGMKEISVTVVHADGTSKEFTHATEQEYLGRAIVEMELVEDNQGPYGLYIETVDGETASWDADQAYWSILIGEEYATVGSLISKELVLHAIDLLLGSERTVCAGLPDRGVVTVTHQAAENRDVVHLLFAHTTVRGKNVEVIEDAVPLYDVPVCLKRDKAPARVYLAPQGEDIPFVYEDGRVKFTVPKVLLHQMVALEDSAV